MANSQRFDFDEFPGVPSAGGMDIVWWWTGEAMLLGVAGVEGDVDFGLAREVENKFSAAHIWTSQMSRWSGRAGVLLYPCLPGAPSRGLLSGSVEADPASVASHVAKA